MNKTFIAPGEFVLHQEHKNIQTFKHSGHNMWKKKKK